MSRQFRRRSGCFAAVAVLATLLALVQLIVACGGAAEPETIAETVEVEKEVTVEVTVAPEPTEPSPPTPISPGAVVQKELERLVAGRIAYNPPTEMTVDKTERVEVRISMDSAAALTTGLKGPGTPVEESIQVSCFMKVRLLGEDFDIVAFSSEEQIVPAEGFSEWAWDVTPTKSGTRTLSLIVTALVKASEAEGEKDLPIIEREIQVKVNPGYIVSSFFVDNRGWIFTAVLLPVLAALGRWAWQRQQRGKESGAPQADEGDAGDA